MGIPIIDTIINAGEKIADKIWMDKDEKEKLAFSREELKEQMNLAIKKMDQDGSLALIDKEYRESQSQRDYAQQQFGTAETLKSFFLGRIILFGRASIRWVITGFAMWQCHRIISYVLTEDVIKGLAAGSLSAGAIWLISLLVSMIVGIPLFYVAGISIEKFLKARSVI